MKKLSFVLILALLFASCIDYTKRYDTCKKKFPGMVVTPATGLLAQSGYQFLAEDTVNNQLYAIMFGEFSETRIADVRNVK